MRPPSVRRLPSIIDDRDPDWCFDQGNEEFILHYAPKGRGMRALVNITVIHRKTRQKVTFQDPDVHIPYGEFEVLE